MMKMVSSTFSSGLRREPIRPFLSGWLGSRGTNSTSSSGFQPFSGESSGGFPRLDFGSLIAIVG
ncbi:NAC domain containing protein 50 [Prunus dulcis]|uniref:NAC domain containing protein 50 n=1 Tax=Prunus dulcis TaxID=3755 RepID=A0A5H2Y4Y8_PRUDU|nr:NAC domain containing protein 50 [Prunus dulcis]